MRQRGERVSTLILQSLWPVPDERIVAAMTGVTRVVVAELNQGQYRREIERMAGGCEVTGVTRVDGELITPEEIMAAV